MSAISKWSLSGLPFEELTRLLSPLPKFRAVQIFRWIAKGISSFNEMDNLPLDLRKDLAERYTLRPQVAVEDKRGADGTVKLALRFADKARIEAVLLADGSARRTACLSTQAGCPAGCVFCKTGTNFTRNLDSAEIVEQFLLLQALAATASAGQHAGLSMKNNKPRSTATKVAWSFTEKEEKSHKDSVQLRDLRGKILLSSTIPGHPVANIVIMGMGEPLLNLGELRRALNVITAKEGLNFSRQRITVSTCGIAEGIADLAKHGPGVRLALSLTTADESLRRRLMPITAGQPLSQVKKALKAFQSNGGGRVTLEAVLLGGINTRAEDATSIAQFARGLDTAVNLIPWNPVKGLEFEGKALQEPSSEEIKAFTRHLKDLGMNVTQRYRKGREVAGACGQLSNEQ
jgi:23S rRNA (adenine2503-C2)-methyltransferase